MRKALIVGINYYEHGNLRLYGCVDDAHSVRAVLERHGDGSVNFSAPKLLTGTGAMDAIRRQDLKDAIEELLRRITKLRSSSSLAWAH